MTEESIVVGPARMACSFGSSPALLVVPESGRERIDGRPVATILDCQPGTSLTPFGLCRSRSNPEVAEASAAAGGKLMPRPCRPQPLGPWEPGCVGRARDGVPLLSPSSRCQCAWAGTISLLDPD